MTVADLLSKFSRLYGNNPFFVVIYTIIWFSLFYAIWFGWHTSWGLKVLATVPLTPFFPSVDAVIDAWKSWRSGKR